MDRIDELFDALSKHNDSKIIRYKYLQVITRIIYLCLKFRYGYQINITQGIDIIEEVEHLGFDYCYGFYGDPDHENMDFFYEGESLKKIFNEVVHFMTCYQGYHDIPDDLYKEFTKDKICTLNDKEQYVNLLKDSWFRKYAKKRIINYFNDKYYYGAHI